MVNEGAIEARLVVGRFGLVVDEAGLSEVEAACILHVPPSCWRNARLSSCPQCLGVDGETRLRLFIELSSMLAGVMTTEAFAVWLREPDERGARPSPLRAMIDFPGALRELTTVIRDELRGL